jgi:hypothetical protein
MIKIMEKELTNINKTLEKIENKLEDKSLTGNYLSNILDFEKMQEISRQKRENERNEELFEMQKNQTNSIKNQEKFSSIVAFTGGILALTAIYTFLIKVVNLEKSPLSYWIITGIFSILILLCIGPLTAFIIDSWKEWILNFKK